MSDETLQTLPDYLSPGLDVIFVGINPGAHSASVGKYFATPRNRFWRALGQSGIVDLGRELRPGDEAVLLKHGIGFTDVVKRASRSASEIRSADLRQWAPVLREKLLECRPLIVCFNGLSGYKWYAQYGEGRRVAPALGLQLETIGESRVFVAPSPSPANAAYSLDVISGWYRRLGELRQTLKTSEAVPE